MDKELQTIKEIFLAACRLEGECRSSFVERSCRGDPFLFQQVHELLQAHSLSVHPIDESPIRRIELSSIPAIGQSVGVYRLIREIGEGGFGVVFEAEQTAPFHRIVALKIIKAGMDTRIYLQRFELERQAMARLSHPSIAALYEGGSTDKGRPYFAMEFVRGEKITHYCRTTTMKLDGKLDLFLDVCQAIEHAHQRGVIHRDIKPSNILVENRSGQSLVKVIDFGIAKIVDSTQANQFPTRVGEFMGTPLYASPEQARGEPVDTRSDIYSLGMVLYELVVGAPPFDPSITFALSHAQSLQYVCETEPIRPSLRLQRAKKKSKVGEASLRDAEQIDRRRIRNELDPIILKAIAKKPGDRYGSVGELMADIDRFRQHVPVIAKRHSIAYVARKFIIRHKALSLSIVLLALLLPSVTMLSIFINFRLNELLERSQESESALLTSNQEVSRQAQSAYIHLARAHIQSRSPGQHFEALDALRSAMIVGRNLEPRTDPMRTVATAALVLPDLRSRVLYEFPGLVDGELALSPQADRLGYADRSQNRFRIVNPTTKQSVLNLELGGWFESVFDYWGPNFSSDSKYLAYPKRIEDQPLLHLWKVGDPNAIGNLGAGANAVAFHPNEEKCAVVYGPGKVGILRLPELTEISAFTTSTQNPYADWSPSGDRLGVWERDNYFVLDGKSLEVLCQHRSTGELFEHHRWHPDGKRMISVDEVGKIWIWDTSTGKELEVLQPSDENRGHILGISSSGRYLAVNNWQQRLRLFDLDTRQAILATSARGTTLHFSKEDGKLFADVQLHRVNYFDFHPVMEVRSILDRDARPFPMENVSVCLSSNQRWLAISSATGIALVDLAIGRVTWELEVAGNRPMRFIDSGLLTYGADGVIHWPIDTWESSTVKIGPPSQLLSEEAIGMWSADESGDRMVGGTIFGHATLVDRQQNKVLVLEDADIRSGGMSSSGRWLTVGTHGSPGWTHLWDTSKMTAIESLSLPIGSLAGFAKEETWLVANADGIQRFDLESPHKYQTITDGSGEFVLSSSSKVLAVELPKNEIELYRMPDGLKLLTLTAPDDTRLRALAFSADDGRLFALGRENGYLYVFDLQKIEHELAKLGMGIDAPWGNKIKSDRPVGNAEVEFQVDYGEFARWHESGSLFRKGERLNSDGKRDEAIHLYRQSAELHPQRSDAQNNLAWQLALYGTSEIEFQEAYTRAKAATQFGGHIPGHWNTLALACWRVGHFDKALAAARESMSRTAPVVDRFDLLIETVAIFRIEHSDKSRTQWESIQQSYRPGDIEYDILFEEAKKVFVTESESSPSEP